MDKKRRRLVLLFFFFLIVLSLICGLTFILIRVALIGDRREPKPELDGVTIRTLAELPGDRAYPEAITVGPDGNIYVSGFCTGTIWKITPDGKRTTWYDGDEIAAASGAAFAPDGSLYVADRGDCNPRRGRASVKRISADGQMVERIGNIGENDIPNSLTFDSQGMLYLTDTQHGSVRRLVENEFETWWQLPAGSDARPTGLAYDTLNDMLIVADTETGTIFRVGFDAERNPTEPETLYEENARELDGLTVDEQGRIFITLYDINKIALLMPEIGLTILARDFREPSDIAYLNGVLYVTNFDSVSLAPLVGILLDPSLPFTVDAVTLPEDFSQSTN